MKRLLTIGGGAIGIGMILFAFYFGTRPSAAFQDLREAISSRDRNAMQRLVDFPALRESVKRKLRDDMSESAVTSKNPFAILGAMLADKLIDSMVDIVVSPGGITAMFSGQNVRDVSQSRSPAGIQQSSQAPSAYDGAWDGLSRYVVTIRNERKEPVLLVMHRQGLFDWRLAELR